MVKYLHIGVKGVRKCNFYTYFRHCIYSFKERGWEVQKPHCSHVIYEWYLIAIWRGPQPKGRSVFPSFLSDPRIKDTTGDFILQVNFYQKDSFDNPEASSKSLQGNSTRKLLLTEETKISRYVSTA